MQAVLCEDESARIVKTRHKLTGQDMILNLFGQIPKDSRRFFHRVFNIGWEGFRSL